ncbi:MAG: TIGR00375 family protein [Firmicutes bacterium]|nr:TIGR00375 family protein [Bacillota bacterium]
MMVKRTVPLKNDRKIKLLETIADLHIHVGFVGERPIKIPASPDLMVGNILKKSRDLGIGVIGVADCHSPYVTKELAGWIERGDLTPLPGGGLRWEDSVTLIPAVEVETSEEGPRIPGKSSRSSHHMVYLPDLEKLEEFNQLWREARRKERVGAARALEIADRVGGMFIPAHIFTPHKGMLGCAADRSEDIFGSRMIPAIEVGLSADSEMADRLSENYSRSFLTNSDAHSVKRIGREHSSLLLAGENLDEVRKAVLREEGRRVTANFGMLPVLGKYYRTCCRSCRVITRQPPPVTVCSECGSPLVDLGVMDRVEMIADRTAPKHPPHRPPYHHLIPLESFSGIGARKVERLLDEYGSEKAVLWCADEAGLERIAGPATAGLILRARAGEAAVTPGGGGKFGKIDRAKQ